MPETTEDVYEFGPFRLEVSERRLLRRGRPVALKAKTLDILVTLVRRSGHLVTKEELMRDVWPGQIVEENNLTVRVSDLRKALSERPRGRKYIATVQGRGYRFVGEVRRGGAAGDDADAPDAPGGASAPETVNSLAVLPFSNESGDPGLEFLSDGISESILNALTHLTHLRVMARSTVHRYKGRGLDVRTVGRQLNVTAGLAGWVRRQGDHVTLGVELVSVADGSRMWGAHYSGHFSELLLTQAEISRQVSQRLSPKVSDQERVLIAKRPTESAEAYELYLRGRHFWNRFMPDMLRKGIECFRRAIEIDPEFALAYAGLADCYYRLTDVPPREIMPLALAAAREALRLDDTLAEAHASYGMVKLFSEYDWETAGRAYRRALELNPGSAIARQRYSTMLCMAGRFEEAMAQARQALLLDPLSLQCNARLGFNLYLTGDLDAALAQLARVLELDDYYPAHFGIALVHALRGRYDEAADAFRRSFELSDTLQCLSFLGYAYGLGGRVREAEETLDALRRRASRQYVSPFYEAMVYVGLGRREQALTLLEQSVEAREEYMLFVHVAPWLDSLRDEPRFEALARRVGIPRGDDDE